MDFLTRMEQELPLQTVNFEMPIKEKSTQKDDDEEDSDEHVQESVMKIEQMEKPWRELEMFLRHGPPDGYKCEQGLIWMH